MVECDEIAIHRNCIRGLSVFPPLSLAHSLFPMKATMGTRGRCVRKAFHESEVFRLTVACVCTCCRIRGDDSGHTETPNDRRTVMNRVRRSPGETADWEERKRGAHATPIGKEAGWCYWSGKRKLTEDKQNKQANTDCNWLVLFWS